MDIMADMEVMERRKRNMGTNKRQIVWVVVTLLAVLNLVVLFVWPEKIAAVFGKSQEYHSEVAEEDSKGSGEAQLSVPEEKRTFNGKGIFNPMEGVEAQDVDGSDLTEHVSVTYSSGKTPSEKQIRYRVYDSEGNQMEAEQILDLENYKGPSITLGVVQSVSWEELQNLTEVLVEKGLLKADDGFGNDVSRGVVFSYEILYESRQAEVTFSFINDFQDFKSEKCLIQVDNLPDEYMEQME